MRPGNTTSTSLLASSLRQARCWQAYALCSVCACAELCSQVEAAFQSSFCKPVQARSDPSLPATVLFFSTFHWLRAQRFLSFGCGSSFGESSGARCREGLGLFVSFLCQHARGRCWDPAIAPVSPGISPPSCTPGRKFVPWAAYYNMQSHSRGLCFGDVRLIITICSEPSFRMITQTPNPQL